MSQCAGKTWWNGRPSRCGSHALKGGEYCHVHDPERKKAAKAQRDAVWEAKRVATEAANQRYRNRQDDAERMEWLAEHYADSTAIYRKAGTQQVWKWIEDNMLRMGSLRACIDHLREQS